MEGVQLLIRRKADPTSADKKGKKAAELAKDEAIRGAHQPPFTLNPEPRTRNTSRGRSHRGVLGPWALGPLGSGGD